MNLDKLAREKGVHRCIGCGQCTWACPASHRGGDFSPRTVVEKYVSRGGIPPDGDLWSCTACGICTEICDKGVDFHGFVRDARTSIRESVAPEITHGGTIQVLRDLQSQRTISPRPHNWLTPDCEIDERSSTLLFVGCLPYFDVVFEHLREDLLDIPRAGVRLLNAAGITPALTEEKCCGHDAYWLGEDESFRELARWNVNRIQEQEIEEVITLCPEGHATFTHLYPQALGTLDFEVRHITEVISDSLKRKEIGFESAGIHITYQDPCRLSRYSRILESPRAVLRAAGRLSEMPRSREMSACCGHSCWVNCDSYTKGWQMRRLEEAKETGANLLVTACPKCLIHLSCAQYNSLEDRKTIEIQDLLTFALQHLE